MVPKTYARLVGGTVMEIIQTAADIGKLYHPGIQWTDITGQPVRPGWTRPSAVAAFAPPAAPVVASIPASIAELQAELALLGTRLAALQIPPTH